MKPVRQIFLDGIKAAEGAREAFLSDNCQTILNMAFKTAEIFANGGKLLLCGNTFIGRYISGICAWGYELARPPLPAIVLDAHVEDFFRGSPEKGNGTNFSRQVEALGNRGDLLLALGDECQANVFYQALGAARDYGLSVASIMFAAGIDNAGAEDLRIFAPALPAPLQNDLLLGFANQYCPLVDYFLFENPGARP